MVDVIRFAVSAFRAEGAFVLWLQRRGCGQGRDAPLWSLSPKYRAAEKVAQTILDEYGGKATEINYKDIVLKVREMKIPFRSPDIADLAAQYLHEKGIKVWR